MRNFEASIPVGFFCYPISQAADITAKAALMKRHGISDSASTIQKRQKQKY